MVSTLLSGLGTGKSTVLGRHLDILRAHCQDPDLQKLLSTSPLVVNLSYNSTMSFTSHELEASAQVGLARRMLSSYFGILWPSAQTLRLSDAPDVVVRTLELLVAHHKKQRGVKASGQVAVILSVDELNSIPETMLGSGRDSELKAQSMVGALTKELRGLSMNGVCNRCPVFPLVAGTAHEQFIAATQGSGVLPLVETLPVLNEAAVFKILRGCGVDERYLSHPEFVRLLDDTGGVPRLVRLAMEGLTVEYDPARIAIGRKLVEQYLNRKLQRLPLTVVRALLPVVLLGQTVSPATTLAASSSTTYSDLQRMGSVWLQVASGIEYRVVVPLLVLRNICDQHPGDVEVSRVRHMLGLLGRPGWEAFEELLACHHAFLSRTLSRQRSTITLGDLYQGVEMHPNLAALEIKLSAKKNYRAWPRLSGEAAHRFPLPAGLSKQPLAKAEAEHLATLLMRGVIVLNSHGAAVDILQVDPLTNGGIVVRALCLMHTVGATQLRPQKVHADRVKAVQAVEGCKQLAALCQGVALRCVPVHISNAVVVDTVDCAPPDAIVIGQHNLETVFGPVLGRSMQPSRLRVESVAAGQEDPVKRPRGRPAKAPATAPHKGRGYSTLRVPHTALDLGATPLPTGVRRLAKATRILLRLV